MKVLFVCRGNVGRSQIAEALLKKKAGGFFRVSSAGTKLSGPEQPIGELMPDVDNLLKVMTEIGVDVSFNIRRRVTPEMADEADKIIMLVDDQDQVPDYLTNNSKVIKWDIPDLKGKDTEFTRKTRNRISELVDKLIEEYK